MKFFSAIFLCTLVLLPLSLRAESLNEKQIETFLGAGYSSAEVQAQVKKQSYSGAVDVETVQRLRKAGADIDLIQLLTSNAGTAPAAEPASQNTESAATTPKNDNSDTGSSDQIPSDASAFYTEGTKRFGSKDFDGAIADFTKAIEIYPKYFKAYFARGCAKQSTKEKDMAGSIADFTKAIEINPSDVFSYIYRGQVYQEIKDFKGTISDFKKAIELDPKKARAYFDQPGNGSALVDQLFEKAKKNQKKSDLAEGNLGTNQSTDGSSASSTASSCSAVQAGGKFTNSLGMTLVPVPDTKILMGTTEVTVNQYKAAGLGYQAPKFPQAGNHPAVNISWKDAKAYCAWLSKKEGKNYRLPTDREWSCAVGIGGMESEEGSPESKCMKIADVYPWGSGEPPKGAGNYQGKERKDEAPTIRDEIINGPYSVDFFFKYKDRYVYTAPVGSYTPNNLGIYDLGGNVWEWCEDNYSENDIIPNHVKRGASYNEIDNIDLNSSYRYPCSSQLPDADPDTGIRVVCEVASGR